MSTPPPTPAEPPEPAAGPDPAPEPAQALPAGPPPPLPPEAPLAAQTVAQTVAQTAPPARERPRRRRGRTALLLACAALLGAVGGLAGGYTVQADRAPTPLPPLSQAKLSYPQKPLPEDEAPEPLTAEEDRRVRTDGDLRKLLLDRPKGTRELELSPDIDGWLSPSAYAREFENPGYMFTYLTGGDLRRVASTGWEQGRYRTVSVSLVQFREEKNRFALEYAQGQQDYMSYEDHAGNDGTALEGSGNGRYYVFDEPHRESGYLPMYRARAIAQRGDIMMDIWIYDTKPIAKRDIRSLAERQLERL
ncbi:hypothetical protein SAMN05192584_101489 [Streptomyces pini]|uniref:Uncharacterized protein n=1 Tax=Streptomyces pini TaxID=1520580 RepID=A0A1I3UK80_9ACTN|nr:hypothetical protein SAMN05192584_101489 [Streptomyces pini]